MSSAWRTLGRLEWQALALLALMFVSGAAVGAAADRVFLHRAHGKPGEPLPEHAGGPPRGDRPGLPPYLEQLGLDYAQHERIRTILDAQKPKVDTLMNGVLPRLRAISDTTFAQIRTVLTPEQQERYDRERPRRALAPGMPTGPHEGGMRQPPPMR